MLVGTTLKNRYRILRKLDRDSFGETYLAEDLKIPGNPLCQIKHLHQWSQNSDRLTRTLDRFQEEGEFYLVQIYDEGLTSNILNRLLEVIPVIRANKGSYRQLEPLLNRNRREVLRWMLLGGVGFAATLLWENLGGNRLATASGAKLSSQLGNTKTEKFTTVRVNSRGKIIERRQGKAQVLTENLGKDATLEMIALAGGTFVMGSPETEVQRYSYETSKHPVRLFDFFLGKYPVTQKQYQAVMGKNPSHFKGANRPVEGVSWEDASEFCQRLSQLTGKNYRLPTEAEWEYACRAGTTTPFYFGETLTPELANYDGNSTYGSGAKGIYRRTTNEVDSFPPNGFGLYDMHGNVWEWCQDIWHESYKDAPTNGKAWETLGDSTYRVQRGGSWWYSLANCRSSARGRLTVGYKWSHGGFRVALGPEL